MNFMNPVTLSDFKSAKSAISLGPRVSSFGGTIRTVQAKRASQPGR